MPLKSIAPTVLQPYQSNNPIDMDWLSEQLGRMESQQQEARDTAFKTKVAMQSQTPLDVDKEAFKVTTGRIGPQLEQLASSNLTPGQMQYEARRMGREHTLALAPYEARSLAYNTQKAEYEKLGHPGDMVELAMNDWVRNNLTPIDPNGDNFGTIKGQSRILADHVDIPAKFQTYADAIDPVQWNLITDGGTGFNLDLAYKRLGEEAVTDALTAAGVTEASLGELDGFKISQIKESLVRNVIESAAKNDPGLRANIGDRVDLTVANKDPEELKQELILFRTGKLNELRLEHQNHIAYLDSQREAGDITDNEYYAAIENLEHQLASKEKYFAGKDSSGKYTFDEAKYVEHELIEPLIQNAIQMNARTDAVLDKPSDALRKSRSKPSGAGLTAPEEKNHGVPEPSRQSGLWDDSESGKGGENALANIAEVQKAGEQGPYLSDKEYEDLVLNVGEDSELSEEEKAKYRRNKKIVDSHDAQYEDMYGPVVDRVLAQMNLEDPSGSYTKEDVYDIFKSEYGTKETGYLTWEGVGRRAADAGIGALAGPLGSAVGIAKGLLDTPALQTAKEYEKFSPELLDLLTGERDKYLQNLNNYSGDGTVYNVIRDKAALAQDQTSRSLMRDIAGSLTPVAQNEIMDEMGSPWWGRNGIMGIDEGKDKIEALKHYIYGVGKFTTSGAAWVKDIKIPGEILPLEITFDNPLGQSLTVQIKNLDTQKAVMEHFGYKDEANNLYLYSDANNKEMSENRQMELPYTNTSAAAGPSKLFSVNGKTSITLSMSGHDNERVSIDNAIQNIGIMTGAIPMIPAQEASGEIKKGDPVKDTATINSLQNVIISNVRALLIKHDPTGAGAMSHEQIKAYINSLSTRTGSESAQSQAILVDINNRYPAIKALFDDDPYTGKSPILDQPLEFAGRGPAASYERILARVLSEQE